MIQTGAQACTRHLIFNQREKRPAIRNQFGSSAPSAPLCRSSIFSKLCVYLAREIARNRPAEENIYCAVLSSHGKSEKRRERKFFTPSDVLSPMEFLPFSFSVSSFSSSSLCSVVARNRICRRTCTLLPRFEKTRTIWTLVIRFGKNAKTGGLPEYPGTRGQLDPRPTSNVGRAWRRRGWREEIRKKDRWRRERARLS